MSNDFAIVRLDFFDYLKSSTKYRNYSFPTSSEKTKTKREQKITFEFKGVRLTENGDMEIFVNGISEGIAARGIPLPSEENKIWAVIDMYGACQQISVHNQPPVSEADWELPQDIQQQEIESDGQGSMVSTDFTCQTDFTSSGKTFSKGFAS